MADETLLVVVAALILIAAAGVGLRVRSRAAAAALLPPLPDLCRSATGGGRAPAPRGRAGPPRPNVCGRGRRARHRVSRRSVLRRRRPRPIAPRCGSRPDDWQWTYRLALRPPRARRGRGGRRAAARRSLRPTRAWRWRGCGSATPSSSARATRRPTRPTAARRLRRAQRTRPPRCPRLSRRDARPFRSPRMPRSDGRASRFSKGERRSRDGRRSRSWSRATPRFGAAHRLLGDTYERLGEHDKAARHVARAAALPAYSAAPDPMVDALARESRSSVLLLKQASAADLVRDAAWREYLVRRALEFDAAQSRRRLRDGRAAAAAEASARGAAVLQASSRHGRATISRRWSRSASATPISAGSRRPKPCFAARSHSRTMRLASTTWATCSSRSGRADEAERHYQRALALNPGLASAHTNLGTALARHADDSRTPPRTSPRRCGSSRETPPRATTSARVLLQQRQLEAASRQFRLALELNPDHADAHANLGVGARANRAPTTRRCASSTRRCGSIRGTPRRARTGARCWLAPRPRITVEPA